VAQTNVSFTLLIVSRDNGFRELVKRHVGGLVVVVGEASDAEQAVSMAKRLRPDVVLMEMGVGVLDGAEAARRMKAERTETKVILLSSSETALDVNGNGRPSLRAVAPHADAVIEKDRIVSDIHSEEWSAHVRRRRLQR
jgi:CheY-like chemotaxis protein